MNKLTVYPLPDKSNLAYLDAQYFNNGKQQGRSEHIIKVQFRTKRGELQSFLIPVTCDHYRIARIAKDQLDAEAAALVKEKTKLLRAEGADYFFGMRMVRYSFKRKGKTIHQKRYDALTQCWLIAQADHIEVEILWAGEFVRLKIFQHEERKHEKQSHGIGYYNPDEELKQFMEKKHGKTTQTASVGATTTADSRTESSGRSEVTSEESRLSEIDSGREDLGNSEVVADTRGNRKANRVCGSDQAPLVVQDDQHESKDEGMGESSYCRPGESFSQAYKRHAKQWMVDREQFGIWSSEESAEAQTGLGTQFRF